jgi:signal transduction histidine kinase
MPHRQSPTNRLRLVAITAFTTAAIALALTVFVHSLGWVDRTFPGFLLMDNRVVPSVGLDHWTGIHGGPIYQREVVAVDDVPVSSADTVYERVAHAQPGTSFRYELLGNGSREERVIAAMRFTYGDYASLFGALLLNGIIFTAVGIAVWVLGPRTATTAGTVALALDAGIFCLTAMDLYGPASFFRIHITSEALFPATLLHLTLVFPVVRLGRWRRPALGAIYSLAALLVALYQFYLYDPDTYSRIHNACMAALGVGGVPLIACGVHAYRTSTSLLVRKRLGIVLVGTIAGFAIPAWLLIMSGISGGDRALNLAAFTAFLFPLSLAYAVVKLDLFEIDAMLRRAVTYLLLTGVVAGIYAVLVLGFGFALQTTNVASSPAFPLVFSLLMIGLFNPMRARVQRTVDRLYDRTSHNAQKTLERASGALVATLNLDDIYTLTLETICRALLIDDASLWLEGGGGDLALVHTSGTQPTMGPLVPAGHPLVDRLRRGSRAVSVYDFPEEVAGGRDERACQTALAALSAELVLPLRMGGDLIGMIALGKKKSYTLFTLDDLDFLSTFANQAVVSILNARSYRKIEELNVNLEHKVERRTSELATTNQELARSLGELERAYHDLQRSQENLVRAEKMAALGRLTAGIAHEVNTPLGASLNTLKMMDELVREYTSSIGDPGVNDDDHREMAAELQELVANVSKWTGKAAGYIRSIKAHTRTVDRAEDRSFAVAQLIDDTRLLLSHRLRLSSCSVRVTCPPDVTLYGDPGKLGQVLTNLITNAIDAYEGSRVEDGVIAIEVVPAHDYVEIAVEDQGCGIAPENLQKIFEELFTTKPAGKGTGLGLSISRDIISDFGGRITVASSPGDGSRFVLWIPRRQPTATTTPEPQRAAAGT